MELLNVGKIIELNELEKRRFLITKKTEGGFGVVYFLKSLSDFPNCVMKIFKNNEAREDIEREAFAWAQLGAHQNIANYLCFGTYNSLPYVLSLRYKETLDSLIGRVTDIETIKQLFWGVVSGLKYANEKLNLIHRDIKPANIFVDGTTPKIGDFGIALFDKFIYKFDDNTKSFIKFSEHKKETIAGTYPFMAPELILGNKAEFSVSTDIYALGITFFLFFSDGRLPYDIKTHSIYSDSFNIFNKNCKEITFRNLILKCIELDKNKRFQKYEDFYNIIKSETSLSKKTLSDIVNTIQLLRRMNKNDQALAYAKEEFKNSNKHPLIINQIAIIYECMKDEKTFEFILSDFFDSCEINYDEEFYYDPLFTLANFYFKYDKLDKFIFYIKKFDFSLKQNFFKSSLYPEYGIFLALNQSYEEAYDILAKNAHNIRLPPKYWLFFCCICKITNRYDELKNILRTKNGEFENTLLNDIGTEAKFETLISQCRKNYKEFMDVIF